MWLRFARYHFASKLGFAQKTGHRWRSSSVRPTPIPGVPTEVKSHRLTGLVKPKSLQVVHVVNNVESLRQARMRAALEKKLPKLGKWKQKFNARNIPRNCARRQCDWFRSIP